MVHVQFYTDLAAVVLYLGSSCSHTRFDSELLKLAYVPYNKERACQRINASAGSVMPTYRQTGKMAINASSGIIFPDPDVLKRLVITDSGFIFDPHLGKTYSTNSAGLIILKHIQNGKNLDQIIESVTKEFKVNREEAKRDVIDFIYSLQGQMK